MRKLLALAVAISAVTTAQPVPTVNRPITDPKAIISPPSTRAGPIPFEDLVIARSPGSAAWSIDGSTVFLSTNLTGRFNIWRVASIGGWPVQLTNSDEAQHSLVPSPDGRRLLFLQDRGGDEFNDVFTVPVEGGLVARLTATADIDETYPVYSPDGRSIAIASRTRASSSLDLAVLDAQTGTARSLVREHDADFRWMPIAWTPDGKHILANRSHVAATRGSVELVDASTGKAVALTPRDTAALAVASDISPDGSMVALSTDQRGGQAEAALFEIGSGRLRFIGTSPWERTTGGFSPDGKSMLLMTNEDGRTRLALADVATGSERQVELPVGVNARGAQSSSSFSNDGTRLLIRHSGSTRPPDLWIANVRAAAPRPLTTLSMASIPGEAFAGSSIVTYTSFDGTPISAVLTMPFNLRRDRSHPAIVIPHGGPTTQTLDNFGLITSALASRGYLVIAPNYRGSPGYGKAFQMASVKDLGGADLKDVLAAKEFLVATGYVDPSRVGITGGSYGGAMTMNALGRAPGVFAAGVQHYGVVNFRTMHSQPNARLRAYFEEMLGRPDTDGKVYDAASPLTYVKAIRAPLLSLQGDSDTRVPRAQAEEVAAALRSSGVIHETIFYPAEGHGFRKRENQLDVIKRTVEWFDRHLKDSRR